MTVVTAEAEQTKIFSETVTNGDGLEAVTVFE